RSGTSGRVVTACRLDTGTRWQHAASGSRAGEHAHRAADTAHSRLGPGDKPSPAGLSSQTQRRLIYDSSIEGPDYFRVTWPVPDSVFDRALGLGRGRAGRRRRLPRRMTVTVQLPKLR